MLSEGKTTTTKTIECLQIEMIIAGERQVIIALMNEWKMPGRLMRLEGVVNWRGFVRCLTQVDYSCLVAPAICLGYPPLTIYTNPHATKCAHFSMDKEKFFLPSSLLEVEKMFP